MEVLRPIACQQMLAGQQHRQGQQLLEWMRQPAVPMQQQQLLLVLAPQTAA
jgi:hypothetical protein